jgi:hypothetical protein
MSVCSYSVFSHYLNIDASIHTHIHTYINWLIHHKLGDSFTYDSSKDICLYSLIWINHFMNWSLEQWWTNYLSLVYWLTHLFMYASIHLWSRFHSLILPPKSLSVHHSFIHPFLHRITHFTDLSFNPPTHLFLYLLIHSLIYLFTKFSKNLPFNWFIC